MVMQYLIHGPAPELWCPPPPISMIFAQTLSKGHKIKKDWASNKSKKHFIIRFIQKQFVIGLQSLDWTFPKLP